MHVQRLIRSSGRFVCSGAMAAEHWQMSESDVDVLVTFEIRRLRSAFWLLSRVARRD